MSVPHVIKIALSAALLTLVAAIIAATIGINDTSATTGLWARILLVLVALFASAAFWAGRIPVKAHAGSTIFAGLLAAWALNPQSWVGRSFGGQLLVETGSASAGADLLLWAIAAAAVASLIHTRLAV